MMRTGRVDASGGSRCRTTWTNVSAATAAKAIAHAATRYAAAMDMLLSRYGSQPQRDDLTRSMSPKGLRKRCHTLVSRHALKRAGEPTAVARLLEKFFPALGKIPPGTLTTRLGRERHDREDEAGPKAGMKQYSLEKPDVDAPWPIPRR